MTWKLRSPEHCGELISLALMLAVGLAVSACASGNVNTVNPDTNPDTRTIEDVVAQARITFEEEMTPLPVGKLSHSVQAAFERVVGDNIIHQVTLDIYTERDFAPLILKDGSWGDDADAVVAAFATADEHAMQKAYPDPALFEEARTRLPVLSSGLEELRHFEATSKEWGAVAAQLDQEGFDPEDPQAVEKLLSRLQSSGDDNPLPRLADRIRTVEFLSTEWAEMVGETEAKLAIATATWASEMRLGWPKNTPRLKLWAGLTSKDTRFRARVRAWFDQLEDSGAQVALAELYPRHPDYTPLVEARKRYVNIAQNGGWGEVSFNARRLKRLKRGRELVGIDRLKERLQIEGYWDGEMDNRYSDELISAIKVYQRTHQLNDDGEIDSGLIRNLNLPVEDRLAKIDVTLRRYRRTPVGTFKDYILVNLPDFHAEVWRGGKRAMRFGIVVGNNRLQRDTAGKVVRDEETNDVIHPNRTPIQTAFMKYVIYNPYWNVPERIQQEELDLKLLEDPWWYQNNGYEIVNPDNPRLMYVRELPGPNNTLGRVKFIFPNPYDVFLHDTQHKSLFRRPVRAYSHGCMRVSKPLEFARHLLEEDGQWDARRVRDILNTEPYVETTFRLRDEVPVHIDYFNTRVDDDGHVEFLSDIYDYDKLDVERRTAELRQQFSEDAVAAQSD